MRKRQTNRERERVNEKETQTDRQSVQDVKTSQGSGANGGPVMPNYR